MAQSDPLCVYCRRPRIDQAWRPFCSDRCRMADLGRWLSEDYKVADENGEGLPDDDAERDGEPS